jgi:hypothetical protein
VRPPRALLVIPSSAYMASLSVLACVLTGRQGGWQYVVRNGSRMACHPHKRCNGWVCILHLQFLVRLPVMPHQDCCHSVLDQGHWSAIA